jgi:Zn-dependent protease with chaperone function
MKSRSSSESKAQRRTTAKDLGPYARCPADNWQLSGKTVNRKPRRHQTNPFRVPLAIFRVLYFPYVFSICLLTGTVTGSLLSFAFSRIPASKVEVYFRLIAALIGIAGVISIVHVFWALRVFFRRPPAADPLEFELPRQWQEGLVRLVRDVGYQRGIVPPDVIRIHPFDVAKVYRDTRLGTILVIGGLAIAALSQSALAGIIAHELGHEEAGDTALSLSASRGHRVMSQLENQFARARWYRCNPLAWLITAYHWVYLLFLFADSRREEFAADRFSVAHAGKESAAATLVRMEVLHRMEWASLEAVAIWAVKMNEPVEQLYAEQVERMRRADRYEWEQAMRKGLKAKTGLFDSHPGLADRLKAIGVSPKKALARAMDLSGDPATALFANWPVVERFLTDQILAIVRHYVAARREHLEILYAIARR